MTLAQCCRETLLEIGLPETAIQKAIDQVRIEFGSGWDTDLLDEREVRFMKARIAEGVVRLIVEPGFLEQVNSESRSYRKKFSLN